MTRYLFPPSVVDAYGARCLDGSPAGFFSSPGVGAGANSWVLFLQGGGACYLNTGTDSTNCFVREKTPLGTSTLWPATYTDSGNVLDVSPNINPDFSSWGHVFIPYCSGDVHTGTRDAPVSADYPFFFSGHRIVSAVLDTLLNTTRIGAADAVLLAGSSAGGIGTFANADFVATRLPGVKRFRASPQGGWFFPQTVNYTAFTAGDVGPPFAGTTPALSGLWQSLVSPACAQAFNASYCGSVGSNYPFIKTPLFVVENMADSNQIFVQQGCPLAHTPAVEAYVQYTVREMRASVGQVNASGSTKTPPDGAFVPNCVAHTGNTGVGSTTTINGVSLSAALGAWFFDRANGVPTVVVDGCTAFDCNPTCPPMPTRGDGDGLRAALPTLTGRA